MARCEICNKDNYSGRRIAITRSQISRRSKTKQKANVKRVIVIKDGVPQKMHICTRCLRSGAALKLDK